MKKMIIVLLLAFALITPVHAESLNLTPNAASSILIDANTKKILYQKNEKEKQYPASTTKIMTLILLFEALNKNKINEKDVLTCSAYAASMGGSQIYLEEGERMSVGDLLKSIAIASANDACVVIAERLGGTHERFVEMMNDKAKELQCTNTQFVNCTGLHDDNHYTCAYDLALMGSYLLKVGKEKLLSITSLYDSYIREDHAQKFWLVNTNKLLKQYEGVDGLKTGYTKEAGYCIVTTIKKNGLRLIGVVMKEKEPKVRNQEMIQLLDYGFSLYEDKILFKKGDLIEKRVIRNAKEKEVEIVPIDDVHYINQKGNEDKITYRCEIDSLIPPLKKDEQIGRLSLYLGQECIGSYPITVSKDIESLSLFELVYDYLGDFV